MLLIVSVGGRLRKWNLEEGWTAGTNNFRSLISHYMQQIYFWLSFHLVCGYCLKKYTQENNFSAWVVSKAFPWSVIGISSSLHLSVSGWKLYMGNLKQYLWTNTLGNLQMRKLDHTLVKNMCPVLDGLNITQSWNTEMKFCAFEDCTCIILPWSEKKTLGDKHAAGILYHQ